MFFSKVSGTTFAKPDWSKLRPWKKLSILHDGDNPADNNAMVITDGEQKLGYLPSETAKSVIALYSEVATFQAIITEITGGTQEKPHRGINIMVLEGLTDELLLTRYMAEHPTPNLEELTKIMAGAPPTTIKDPKAKEPVKMDAAKTPTKGPVEELKYVPAGVGVISEPKTMLVIIGPRGQNLQSLRDLGYKIMTSMFIIHESECDVQEAQCPRCGKIYQSLAGDGRLKYCSCGR